MRIEHKLTDGQLNELGQRIIADIFRRLEGGLMFGLDWNTASLLFPRQMSVYNRLRREWRARHSL